MLTDELDLSEMCSRTFWADFRHYCRRVSLDPLFESRSEELVLICDKVLAKVANWPKVLNSTTPNCIVCYRRTGFFVVRLMKKWLDSSSTQKLHTKINR